MHVDARRFSEEQVSKNGPAFIVDTGNLTIEHGGFNLQVFHQPHSEFSEAAEGVSVSRDKLALKFGQTGTKSGTRGTQWHPPLIRMHVLHAYDQPDYPTRET